jgi:hypothetical protein
VSGAGARLFRPTGRNTTPVRCDAIALVDDNPTEADGFDFLHAPATLAPSAFMDRIHRAMITSTYFRRHFLVFSADSDPTMIQRAIDVFNATATESIAIIKLTSAGSRPTIRQAKGLPYPDRRTDLLRFCEDDRWREDWMDPEPAMPAFG